jgi:hypothetical protein
MFESKNDLSARIKVLDFGLSKKFLPGMSKLMTEGVGTSCKWINPVNGINSTL